MLLILVEVSVKVLRGVKAWGLEQPRGNCLEYIHCLAAHTLHGYHLRYASGHTLASLLQTEVSCVCVRVAIGRRSTRYMYI